MNAILFLFVVVSFVGLSTSRTYKIHEPQLTAPYKSYIFTLWGVAKGATISTVYNVQNVTDSAFLLLTVAEGFDISLYSAAMKAPMTPDLMDYLCQQPSTVRETLFGTGKSQYTFPSTDRYSVILLRCLTPSSNYTQGNTLSLVEVDVSVHIINPNGSELSIEDIPFVQTALFFLILYVILMVILAGQILRAPTDAVKPIHSLFLFTAAVGVLSNMLYYVWLLNLDQAEPGEESGIGMAILTRAVMHIFDTLFLLSLLLVSFGWSISRTFLPDREKQFTFFCIGSYLLLGLLNSTCTGDSAATVSCNSLNVLTYVVKTLILLGVVVALNISSNQLRSIIQHSPWINNILLQYARSKQFTNFRLAFLFYLLLPTVILLLELSLLSWRTQWITDMMIKLVDVMLSIVVAVNFSPLSESYLSRSFDGSLQGSVSRRAD